MRIFRFVAPFFSANCYVLVVENKALIVDPGSGAAEPVLNFISENDLEIAGVFLTHGHADHVWDTAKVAGGNPTWIAKPDLYRMNDPITTTAGTNPGFAVELLTLGEWHKPNPLEPFPAAAFNGVFEPIPGLKVRILPAPGHTEGSALILLSLRPEAGPGTLDLPDAPVALGGDILFSQSVGRSDLPGGDERLMWQSLRTICNVVDPATTFLPGHGPTITLGEEIRTNPYLRQALKQG